MIRPNHINFSYENITLLLGIDKIEINQEISLKGDKFGLLIKDEFHFTVMGTKTGKKILELIGQNNPQLIEKIKNIADNIEWEIVLEEKYFYLKDKYDIEGSKIKEERQSIIQTASIKGLNEFYQKLNDLINYTFELPFPHITLYCHSTVEERKLRGIGVYSHMHFKELLPEEIVL